MPDKPNITNKLSISVSLISHRGCIMPCHVVMTTVNTEHHRALVLARTNFTGFQTMPILLFLFVTGMVGGGGVGESYSEL